MDDKFDSKTQIEKINSKTYFENLSCNHNSQIRTNQVCLGDIHRLLSKFRSSDYNYKLLSLELHL